MKSYNCEECGELVNELGAFVKRSATRRAHLLCHDARVTNQARDSLINEQREAEAQKQREHTAMLAAAAKAAFDKLPRCPVCGTRTSIQEISPEWAALGEVKLRQSDSERCRECVRTEIQARSAARTQAPVPLNAAQAIQQAPTAPVQPTLKPEEPSRDRFSLIDMD